MSRIAFSNEKCLNLFTVNVSSFIFFSLNIPKAIFEVKLSQLSFCVLNVSNFNVSKFFFCNLNISNNDVSNFTFDW